MISKESNCFKYIELNLTALIETFSINIKVQAAKSNTLFWRTSNKTYPFWLSICLEILGLIIQQFALGVITCCCVN